MVNIINKNPLVTIIMSSFNHEEFVEKAVLSAVNQTYKNIQFIVIDDGSKDNSPAILQKLQDQYNFYLECRTNHGLVKTLNYALKNIATGKYVCVLDSDDYFVLDKIEKQVAMMELHPECGLCYSPLYYIDANDTLISDVIDEKNTKTGYLFEEFFRGDFHIPDGGVLIPLRVFQEIGYYDEDVVLEDYQLWFKILYKYPACYINKHLTYYRTHSSNVSNNEHQMLLYEIQVVDKWKEHPIYEKSKPYLFNRYFAKFAKYDKKRAIEYLFLILQYKMTYANKNLYKGLRRLLFSWK